MIKIFDFEPILKKPTTIMTFNYINNILQGWHDESIEFPDNIDNAEIDRYAKLLFELCRHNYQIWHAEDYCRTKQDELVCKYKPIIDKHNQLRNNTIEDLDVELIKHQLGTGQANSETIGSIIDRLSITILKFLHTVEINTNDRFRDRIDTLIAQILFLLLAFDNLLDDMMNGKSHIKLFRQLKMYNDPETNSKIPK